MISRGISSGAMRHRIQVQQRTEVRGPSGDPEVRWELFAERWASIEPLAGKEFFSSGMRQAKVDTKIRMRYLEGLKPKMRILWDGRWFDIDTVMQIGGMKYEMLIMANELIEYDAGQDAQ